MGNFEELAVQEMANVKGGEQDTSIRKTTEDDGTVIFWEDILV